MNRIKLAIYILPALPAIIAYFVQDSVNKKKIFMDIDRNESVKKIKSHKNNLFRLYRLIATSKEFRSIYYMRIGRISRLISFLLPGETLCGIASTKSENVGGGVYIQHGWGMVLDAQSVGENLWINQNVTVGYRGNGHPRIGNNVRIGTGAVVLGDITIGDNVNIGANAIVTKDVPSNTTVVSPQAYICKRDGIKVYEKL